MRGKEKEEEELGKVKTVEDLLKDAVAGEETRGPTTQYDKQGNKEQALKDFLSTKPTEVREGQTDQGIIKIGKLSNNRTIIYRSWSSNGKPAVEIQNKIASGKIEYTNRTS